MKKDPLTGMVMFCALFLSLIAATAFAGNQVKRQWYQLTIYHFTTAIQENLLNEYLEKACLPALHRQGIPYAGVFRAMANDTAADKKMYVLVPGNSMNQLLQLQQQLLADTVYTAAAEAYLLAPYDATPYQRIEQVYLQAFPRAPVLQLPRLSTPVEERVYELRSYESATEALHRNKVKMFNEGGETVIFSRLGFHPVFYATVVAGSRMPNLMYMTSFENMAARDAHWKAFGNDPVWKKIAALPEYQHNVSRAEILFLQATPYSDL